MTGSFSLILWVVIGTAALLIDLATSSFLFVWFTIGAIAALIAQILQFSMATQIIVFIIVSIIFMAVGYPIIKKILKKEQNSMLSIEKNYMGETFTIDKDIETEGTVKFQGVYWRVGNKWERIKKGDKVEIISTHGNKLFIKKIKED